MKSALTPQQIRQKIYRYCTYQERSHQEVKNKLFEMGLRSGEVDEMLSQLITEGFLNEERFAKAFAGGKFRLKKWGRLKIVNELEMKGLTKNCIRIGLKEIDEEAYKRTLRELIQRKAKELMGINLFVKRDKVSKSIIGKGFEPNLVWQEVKALLPDK